MLKKCSKCHWRKEKNGNSKNRLFNSFGYAITAEQKKKIADESRASGTFDDKYLVSEVIDPVLKFKLQLTINRVLSNKIQAKIYKDLKPNGRTAIDLS